MINWKSGIAALALASAGVGTGTFLSDEIADVAKNLTESEPVYLDEPVCCKREADNSCSFTHSVGCPSCPTPAPAYEDECRSNGGVVYDGGFGLCGCSYRNEHSKSLGKRR